MIASAWLATLMYIRPIRFVRAVITAVIIVMAQLSITVQYVDLLEIKIPQVSFVPVKMDTFSCLKIVIPATLLVSHAKILPHTVPAARINRIY